MTDELLCVCAAGLVTSEGVVLLSIRQDIADGSVCAGGWSLTMLLHKRLIKTNSPTSVPKSKIILTFFQ